MRSAIDHIGITVPDMDEAIAFFCDALNCELVLRDGPADGAPYVWPGESEPEEGSLTCAFLRHGDANIELLEYRDTQSGARSDIPRPSERNATHVCFHVEDIHAALEELGSRGDVRVLGPVCEDVGLLDGLKWVYLMTPWGLVFELVQWKPGMPYEETTSARLAPPPALR